MTSNAIHDNDLLVIGLDGEMSSAEIGTGGRLIQAGLAARRSDGTLDVWSSLIHQPTMEWSKRAAAVHNIMRSDLCRAPSADEVDEVAYQWLLNHGATAGQRQVISVGFNVVAFDHPFFRQTLPRTMSLVSRRGLDLNAVCFTLAGWDPRPTQAARGWTGWKRSAKKAAMSRLTAAGFHGVEHDAGYDAALALEAFDWFREQLAVSMPVPSTQGDPVLARLDAVPTGVLRQLAAAFVATGISASRWIGKRRSELDGRSALDLLQVGDFEVVVSVLKATSAKN